MGRSPAHEATAAGFTPAAGKGSSYRTPQVSAWFLRHKAGEGGQLHWMPQGQGEAPNEPKWFLWPLGQIEAGKKEQ